MRHPLPTMIALAYGWTWVTVLPLLAAVFVLSRTGGAAALRAVLRSFRHWRVGRGWLTFTVLSPVAFLQSLGEEPGWRGCLLPGLLARFGRLPATLLLFPVWWLWHLPFFLSRPEFGVAQLLGFGLGILAASVWMTLLWEGTQSILMAIVWHMLLNITRGIAGAYSTTVFLAYGLVVTLGAVVIVIWWIRTPWSGGRRRAAGCQVPAGAVMDP